MAAAELARFYIDSLHMQVRQDTWGTSCLGSGTCGNAVTDSVGNINYTSTTTANNVPGTTLRWATVQVTWTEP